MSTTPSPKPSDTLDSKTIRGIHAERLRVMIVDSYALEAFQAVAKLRKFTLAAQSLNITQSALSQRIAGLEKHLGTTLFIRQRQGAELSAAGRRLLLYAQAKTKLEEELIGDLSSSTQNCEGTIRVSGFSSIVRSVLLPALAPLLHKFPELRLELQAREIAELAACLLQGETDFVLLYDGIAREGVLSEVVGHEDYVLTEAKQGPVTEALLDHHEDDEITLRYFRRFDPTRGRIFRRYLDESYGLIDGVALGLGRAVLPQHLIASDKRIRVLQPTKILRLPIHLNYLSQPYYTRLQTEIRASLTQGCREYLGEKKR